MWCGGPLQRAAAARWGRVPRAAPAVVTSEYEGRATGGRRENAVYSTYPPYQAARNVIEHMKAHVQQPELLASLEHSILFQEVYDLSMSN